MLETKQWSRWAKTALATGRVGNAALQFLRGSVTDAGAVELAWLQRAGGKRLKAHDFQRGFEIQPGECFDL